MLDYSHRAKKRFGQNFLHDECVINQIVHLINPQPADFIVEIGPGLGALTRPILEYLNTLHVVELDRDIVSHLQQNFNHNQLIIHAADALKFDYTFNQENVRVVGNLPYNISTPLLFYLSKFTNILDMHFMLQKEVVERICASPNCKSYGRLSIMLQYRYNCSNLLFVDSTAFTPSPKVDSAIVRLVPKDANLWQQVNRQQLNHIVTKAFSCRRKTIANSLKNVVSINTLTQLGIDPQKRAENLSVADYIALATQHA